MEVFFSTKIFLTPYFMSCTRCENPYLYWSVRVVLFVVFCGGWILVVEAAYTGNPWLYWLSLLVCVLPGLVLGTIDLSRCEKTYIYWSVRIVFFITFCFGWLMVVIHFLSGNYWFYLTFFLLCVFPGLVLGSIDFYRHRKKKLNPENRIEEEENYLGN